MTQKPAKFTSLKKNWYLYLTGALLLLQALVFFIYRGESYIQIHDNLDLFMAHYQMLKVSHLWFAHHVDAPILHGVSRDLFGSEFSLYNILYVIFPGLVAYFIGYALKIAIGIFSFNLLAKDVLKAPGGCFAEDSYERYKPIIIVTAVAFGLIPVFPTYGIAFTSVPLIVFLLRRLYLLSGEPLKKRIPLYIGVFLYPLLSYFSYHGFFILCYMLAAFIILWIKDRRFPKTMLASLAILSAGFMIFEYRLFGQMLFGDTVTIRTTMDHGDVSFAEAMKLAFVEFVNASFHSQDSHTYVILGTVLISLVVINILHVKNKEAKKILTDPVNLIMLWIIFNVLIFGLYQFYPFRHLVETIVPKLTGFEFARTAYFNTFLWYAELLLVCIRMYDSGRKALGITADIIVTCAVIAVMFIPQMYNDFYYTCYNQAYKVIKQRATSTVNYNEFYSESLFDEIKEDIDYNGEWSAAYCMHPAILNYNGIATVDGYLGMYSQDYKDEWRKIITPALNTSPTIAYYFDSWGARAYLYSPSDENNYAPFRNIWPGDARLMADMDELKKLECKYIFSRIEILNADECGIDLLGRYNNEKSPYTIYVYGLN